MERRLTRAQASSAAAIQREIDLVARTGGRVVLPAMELELDRALQLRSGVELCGQGPDTLLRKGPGRVYPLAGYHNYGMKDVPLKSTAGLAVGMTVSIHDAHTHGGFYETFATIVWIEGDWVGLDHGIEADYRGDAEPCLTTVYPLVCGHFVHDVAVRDLALDGQRDANPIAMGACRGASVYFARSRDIEVANVREFAYNGEGLGFQMCREVAITGSSFAQNTGNGLHPGAGSTNALFTDCQADGNGRAGFFFCVRANHITVRGCRFAGNGTGLSIGTRDCHNLIEGCVLEDNRGPGVQVRDCPVPTEVHSCRIRQCALRRNALGDGSPGAGQIDIPGPAHDLVLDRNTFVGDGAHPGVRVGAEARQIFLEGNVFSDCRPDIETPAAALTASRPGIECGYGDWAAACYRHLDTP